MNPRRMRDYQSIMYIYNNPEKQLLIIWTKLQYVYTRLQSSKHLKCEILYIERDKEKLQRYLVIFRD